VAPASLLQQIRDAAGREVSGTAAAAGLERLWASARYADFAHIHETARTLATMMDDAGLSDVEVLEYPADGVAHYGGWIMPQAWDLSAASLQVVSPGPARQALASYAESPLCVMIHSAPTPPDGVTAPVMRVAGADRPDAWRGVDATGAIVLMDTSSLRAAALAFRHGAVGVLTDERGRPDADPAGYRFLNYTISPAAEPKGFGFGLTHARGAQLRAALDEHGDGNVHAHARVASRLYDGSLPAVTGLLPGESDEEIVLTGHLCEPGANDNTSGPALAVEVVRALGAMARAGSIPPLRRGIRLCHTYEVRGTNAYVNEHGAARNVVAGLNLDMVARRETNHVFRTTPAHPAYTDALLLESLRLADPGVSAPAVRDHAFGLVDDNVFGEPLIGGPCVGLVQYQDRTWHTSSDTMKDIDEEALRSNGIAAATYCAAIACARDDDALALAALAAQDVTDRLNAAANSGSACDTLRHMALQGQRTVRSALALVDGSEAAARVEELGRRVADMGPTTASLAGARGSAATSVPSGESMGGRENERYRKVAPGFLGFEHLTHDERDMLDADQGMGWGWGAPDWLQHAAFLCDGGRDVRDVFLFLHHEGLRVDLPTVVRGVEWAAAQGFLQVI
jgi:hypothetical protein